MRKQAPKYRQIAAALAKEMEEHGGRLVKTQLEIAKEHKVHRLTVRQALNYLEREGKVQHFGGRSFSSVSDEKAPSLRKIGFPIWANSFAEVDLMRFQGSITFAQRAYAELQGVGYELDIQCVGSKWQPNLEKIRRLSEEWAGLILTPMSGESGVDSEHPFASMQDRTAYVGYLQNRPFNCVQPDFFGAGGLALEELAAQGAKRILYTGPERETISHRLMRVAGVEKVAEKHGVELIFAGAGFHVDEAFSAVKQFFQNGGKCDAVIANSGYATLGAMRAMADLGLRVPHDVQLIAIGRMTFWEYLHPRPTVITSESGALAKAATRLAVALAQPDAKPRPNVVVPVYLIRGETTLPLPVGTGSFNVAVHPEFQWI